LNTCGSRYAPSFLLLTIHFSLFIHFPRFLKFLLLTIHFSLPNASRTLRAKPSGVKGFWIKFSSSKWGHQNGVKSTVDPCSKLIKVKSRLDPSGIDIRGKFVPSMCGNRLKDKDGMKYYVVVPASESGTEGLIL
jgi:hypothetical protein